MTNAQTEKVRLAKVLCVNEKWSCLLHWYQAANRKRQHSALSRLCQQESVRGRPES